MNYYIIYRSVLSLAELLQILRLNVLPNLNEGRTRITVRRRYILQDTLHKLRNGLDLTKHPNIIFIGEPAVDDGGPLREFLYRVIVALANNDMLFSGPIKSRVPRHNLVELQKKTYFHVGVIIALSLIYGGPAPQFFSSAVADYIAYGVTKCESQCYGCTRRRNEGTNQKGTNYYNI